MTNPIVVLLTKGRNKLWYSNVFNDKTNFDKYEVHESVTSRELTLEELESLKRNAYDFNPENPINHFLISAEEFTNYFPQYNLINSNYK